MKYKFFVITFTFFLTTTAGRSVAQNYLSLFGDTSTSWDIILDGACDAVCPVSIYVIGDTTINTIPYKKISGLQGFLREDTLQGKAWFYDTNYNTEYLVMDLALNPGDTFNIYDFNNVANPFLVDSVYYRSNKKFVRLNAWTRMCSLDEKITFIEGSGTTAGFCYQRKLNGSSVTSSMLCHHKNGIKVAGNVLFNDTCSVDCSIGIDETAFDKNINIFPNPMNDELYIVTNSSINKIIFLTICNSIGEQIVSQKIINDLTRISTSNLPSGIYHLVVSDNFSNNHQRLIKL